MVFVVGAIILSWSATNWMRFISHIMFFFSILIQCLYISFPFDGLGPSRPMVKKSDLLPTVDGCEILRQLVDSLFHYNRSVYIYVS